MKLLHALTGILAISLSVPAFADPRCSDLDDKSLEAVVDALPTNELKTFAENCRAESKDLAHLADAATDPVEKEKLENAHDKAVDNAAIAGFVAKIK